MSDLPRILKYPKKPNESMYDAIIMAGYLAQLNGFHAYEVVREDGSPIEKEPGRSIGELK